MGKRLKGYLTPFQENQGYYLEEEEHSVALYRFSMGEMDEDGNKISGGEYNPVPIARVDKSADPNLERLIRRLVASVQR